MLASKQVSHRLRSELSFYVGAVGLLVFILLFCEFGLVRLSSSLTLAVFGVLKELLTIIIAAAARGDPLTPTNLSGFTLCGALRRPPTHPQRAAHNRPPLTSATAAHVRSCVHARTSDQMRRPFLHIWPPVCLLLATVWLPAAPVACAFAARCSARV